MSAQQLGAKALHRIERTIGEPVLRGWSHGGYTFGFVTPDHRHGWWSKRDQSWGWHTEPGQMHYASCTETWPDDVAADGRVRQAEYLAARVRQATR